jgi:hypothetical protein
MNIQTLVTKFATWKGPKNKNIAHSSLRFYKKLQIAEEVMCDIKTYTRSENLSVDLINVSCC